MKLIVQIALGVFLGTLATSVSMELWRVQRESEAKQAADTLRAKQEQARHEQGERIRAMLLQGRAGGEEAQNKPAVGFVPDDAQSR